MSIPTLVEMARESIDLSAQLPEAQGSYEKWLHRSALQKACRRGQLDRALRHAAELYSADPSYAFFSMAIIAVEDVGFADLALVQTSTALTLKTVRNKLSADERVLLASMVRSACEATGKSRAFCELSVGAYFKHQPDADTIYPMMLENDLMELLATGTMEETYLASVALRKRYGITDEEDMDRILGVMAEAAPEIDEYAMLPALLGFERPVDTMSNAIYPVMREMYRRNEPFDAVPDDLLTLGDVGEGMASEALDMHTMVGKRAIKAFHTSASKTIPEVREVPKDKAVKALGCIIFIIEGGQVDSRAMNADLADLKQLQDTYFAQGYGVPKGLLEPLCKIVSDERDRLQQKRKWSLNNA